MNPIDTDPRITADMVNEGKLKLSLLNKSIKRLIQMTLGDDFGFVVIMRHKTEAASMLMIANVDSEEEMSDIIAEGYERRKSPEMNRFIEDELYQQEQQH